MQAKRKDYAAGAFFAGVGCFYGIMTLRDLRIGTPANMNAGFFPLVLSLLLIALGAAVAWRGHFSKESAVPFGRLPWRGMVLLTAATLVFAAFIDDLGLLPGVFVVTFIAALASPAVSLLRAALTAGGVAVACTIVFGFGIRLPLPVIGPVFGL